MSIIIQVADHILFEDNDILVINKPCSVMVEPDRNGHPNLLQQVQKYIKQSVHPNKEVYVQHIHRLDRPVSGIVLFAKKKSVLKNLSEQFAQRTVKKKYKALTEKQPLLGKGSLDNWLYKDKKNKKAVIYKEPHPEADNVKLAYITEDYKQFSLWDIDLHTGKYHQIRAQLGFVGCSIIGDALYGSTSNYAPNAIALHAYQLEFVHPSTNEKMTIQASANWLI
ncbi:RluA family pseudouridine synthase [uncultured Cytophaga sp.]|uniref:RluA family pseudouridine synthase n=1 Tax=uncultured Cytophaga sp. TaxID=160238 RepID=UPI00261C13C1|nr:RluA family pseudouridine synthase [uncultured Cytophaga sp.]